MTPKEKAKKLLDYYYFYFKGVKSEYSVKFLCQEIALIAVDELIEQENKYNNGSFYPSKYWQEVKRELQML